jgi:hypothetical protein
MILTIKIYLIVWFITNFELLTDQIDNLFSYLQTKKTNKYITIILNNLYTVLSCQKCLSFWSVLIITLNPYYALSAAIIAQIHTKINNK